MKNKFIASTMILILGGFITKILGFVIKIVYTRIITNDGVNLYSLMVPTYSLLITIATLAMPMAISKLVSEGKKRSLSILMSSVFIMIFINFFLVSIMFFLSKPLAVHLLHNEEVYYLLLAASLTLPFISLSSIVKGYFFGKQKMFPYALSNNLEQVIRLLLIVLFLPFFVKKSILLGVVAFILLNIVSECFSVFVFCFFLPKRTLIRKEDLKLDLGTMKDILGVSLPTVSSRFIGNIGFFFEPILLTQILLSRGFTSAYILTEYGAYNAYSIALLTMPSFFITAISSALIPEISKYHHQGNQEMVKRRLKQALRIAFFIGFLFSLGIFMFRDQLLFTLYGTFNGSQYIKILAPFFVLFYIEAPMQSFLQASNKAKKSFSITLIALVVKLICMCLFAYLKFGIYALVFAEIIDIILVVFLCFKEIKKELAGL